MIRRAGKYDHTLNIVSLHDMRAACSCGGWEMVAAVATSTTPDERRRRIFDAFALHRKGAPRRPWVGPVPLKVGDRVRLSEACLHPQVRGAEAEVVGRGFVKCDQTVHLLIKGYGLYRAHYENTGPLVDVAAARRFDSALSEIRKTGGVL